MTLQTSKLVRAVVGIIKRDNKVLVAERPVGKPYSGYWEFPGGKIEPQESPQEALIRELREELGIDVITAEPWFIHQHHYPDKKVELNMWLVTQFTGEPHSKENQSLRWATHADMLAMRLLEGNWAVMDRVKELL